MINDKPANTQIRTLYSIGYSSLMLSYFKTNLVLSFVPYVGKDDRGFNAYSKNEFLSTSINHDGAAFFYMQAAQLLNGKDLDKPLEVSLPCNNGASLTFVYKPDEKNVYLTINKNDMSIPFMFQTTRYVEKVDGQWVPVVMQTGLGTFAMVLGCYIVGKAANDHIHEYYNDALQQIQEQVREEWERDQAAIVADGNSQGWG
jgi:hypothetical protein